MVRALVIEELDREMNKIVSIPGHKAAYLLGGPVELFPIRKPFSPDLMHADRIDTPNTEQLGDLWTEVLIQVVFQGQSAAREG